MRVVRTNEFVVCKSFRDFAVENCSIFFLVGVASFRDSLIECWTFSKSMNPEMEAMYGIFDPDEDDSSWIPP